MRPAELILWGSLGLALYAYGLYPLIVWLAARWTKDPGAEGVADSGSWPRVTLLITADCDESVILERLQNAAEVNYPFQYLEILVACDGNEELTSLLARTFDDRRVRVIGFPHPRGIAPLLNDCLPQTDGEIVVLSNTRTTMRSDAIRSLVRHFQDPTVGGVCGKLLVIDPRTGRNTEGLYARFEKLLQGYEARLGALPKVNAGIYAFRRTVFAPIPAASAADKSKGTARGAHPGYRFLFDETALAVEKRPPAVEARLDGQRAAAAPPQTGKDALPAGLQPRGGLTALAFNAHRLLRRMCPAFLIAAFVANACLSDEPFYLHCLLIHELVYLFALGALLVVAAWQSRSVPSIAPAEETVPTNVLLDGKSDRWQAAWPKEPSHESSTEAVLKC